MNPRGWRMAALTTTAAAGLAVLLLLAAYAIAHNAVRSATPDTAAALTSLRRQFAGWAVVLLPVAAAVGATLGRRLSRTIHRLRRALLQRAHGDTQQALPPTALRDIAELTDAADRVTEEWSRRLQVSEAQRSTLAVLVDSVTDGLLRIDSAGRIVFANPECRALLELLPSAMGQTYAAVVRHRDLRTIVRRALEGERVSGEELAFGERRILVSAQPLADASAGAVVALADLTQLRRLEGVRRDFVANVSHELKTPLTPIRGYAETLLADDLPRDVQVQFLDVIQKNAARLQQIVDDLLDLSRIESGSWQPQLVPIDAAELVDDVWSTCSALAQKRGTRFEPLAAPVRVLADPGALRQIFTNLFDNAIRYTPEGGLVAVAAVPAPARPGAPGAPPAGWVQFEVRDTGTGIPREALSRIFERFYRVDPARSRAEGGTGLGLSIVKHLVESMGGDVSAHSDLGRGTTIRFTIPALP